MQSLSIRPHLRSLAVTAGLALLRASGFFPKKQQPSEAPAQSAPYASLPRPRSDQEWVQASKDAAVIAVPLNALADDFSQVPWQLWRLGDPGPDGRPERTEVLDHPLKTLWSMPCPALTGMQFRRLALIYLETCGRIPIRVMYGPDGKPASLWLVPPHHVKQMPQISWPVNPAIDRPYWIIKWRGKDVRLKLYEMIWITRPDPEDPYGWGVGTCQALNAEVTIAKYMNQLQAQYFREGAHVGKIVAIPGLNPDNAKQLSSDFEANHTGPGNAHRTLFVGLKDGSHQMSVTDLGPPHKDLDWVGGQKSVGDKCRHVFGTPPERVGDVTNSNRATSDNADYLQMKHSVRPRLFFLAEAINIYLTPLFGEPDLMLEPEECVKETADQKHLFLTDGWKAGTVIRDEWRAGHKMKLLGGDTGRQLNIPVNMAMMDAAGGQLITAYPVKPVSAVSEEGTETAEPPPKLQSIVGHSRLLEDILLHPEPAEEMALLKHFRERRLAYAGTNGAPH